ncbi:hypothetical protein ACFIJ5_12570 [Haloimpatiens sp. FM7330]|uniref:hypothetical protein n=1 Tax=Haloimpatiens sp. FM7330 TaxID=3298610 RepID=UPI00363F1E9F
MKNVYPKTYSIKNLEFGNVKSVHKINSIKSIKSYTDYQNSNNKKSMKRARRILRLKNDLETKAVDVLKNGENILCDADNCFMSREVINDKSEIIARVGNGASLRKYIVFVKSTAKPQINTSKAIFSNKLTPVLDDEKIISIYMGEEKYDISVDIDFEDTNVEVFEKVAKALNDKNIDIDAQVIKISDVVVKLQIKSKHSGLRNKFHIEDKVGRIVCEYNLDDVICKAQNLNCIINDKCYELEDNNIVLDNGKLKITLKKALKGYGILIIRENVRQIVNDISNFIDSYNKLTEGLYYYSRNKRVLDIIDKFINRNQSEFYNIGIIMDKDFKIKFDENIFIKTLKNKKEYTENLIKGKKGLVTIIFNFTKYILNNLFEIVGVESFKVYDSHSSNVSKYNSGSLIQYLF